jgi:RimK-like ATP-grasp domain
MILIIGPDDDKHALIVEQGLSKLGQSNTRWDASCSPLIQKTSLRLDDEPEAVLAREATVWGTSEPTVVWYRREGNIALPQGLGASQLDIFTRETMSTRRGVFSAMGKAFWVNDWINAWAAENKVRQLACAKHIGLPIPRTLVSNSPQDISQFFDECNGDVIHKMFYPAQFDHGKRIAGTNQLTKQHLTHTKSLEICPAIYQEKVAVEFEVRVCIFGETVLAAKLVNQSGTHVDIRTNHFAGVEASTFDLPPVIAEKCIALVHGMGLVSGSIDLAHTKDGNWIFFEVNQSGQFLWLELMVPSLPVLDAFCKFLVHGKRDFRYQKGYLSLHVLDFFEPDSGAIKIAHE